MKFKFKIGQKVRMTKRGIEQGLAPRGKKVPCGGTVKGIKPPLAIIVLRDGTTTKGTYHVDFWQ